MAFGVGMFAAFGGFLFGYDTGYISGLKAMRVFLRHYGELNENGEYELATGTDSLITSILSVGTLIGALASGHVGQYLGRRVGIWAYLVVFCAGVAMQTAAYDVPLFSVGRVFAGLGVGGVSCLVPIYQSESAPKQWRGFIVSAYIGLLVAAIVVERTKDRPDASCWQIPVGIQFVWAFILGVGLIFLPESPRWLLVRGKEEQARRSLARLFRLPLDSPYVAEEYANIAANVHHERSLGKVSYAKLLFKSDEQKLPLRVWTGCFLQGLQQLSGINFIFYYGTTFFKNSGISNPFLITIATNVVNGKSSMLLASIAARA
ncbi:Plasma membrane low glucose sensor [Rhodotorula kratochvilovae]